MPSHHDTPPGIREACAADIPRLTVLCTQLGYPATPQDIERRLDEVMSDPAHAVYIAEGHDGEVVGWAHIFIRRLLVVEPHAELGGLVVDEDHRGRGIGERLMEAVERWTRAQGYKALYVRSNVIREGAHRFYERMGYAIIKTSLTFRKEL